MEDMKLDHPCVGHETVTMASAITTSGGDLDPQTAIELRLRRLEALLHGTPTSVITTDEGNPSLSTTDVGGGVQRRTHELRDALERVPAAKGHEALRRFITHCRWMSAVGRISRYQHANFLALAFVVGR
jgi:hypothetical protein